MLFIDAFKTSTRSLTHGKMRSILTMLGIVIGIASVIVLMSIGQSAQDLIIGQVESVGSNLIIVMPGAPANGKFSSPASAQGIVITSLQQRDVDSLQREPSVNLAVPEVRGRYTPAGAASGPGPPRPAGPSSRQRMHKGSEI